MEQGLVHIYCGDGKGKTTAAAGLALRALGRGMKVLFVQFLKGQDSGEITMLRSLPGVQVLRGKQGEKFTFSMTAQELAQCRRQQDSCLQQAAEMVKSGQFQMLVLDEVMGAISTGTLSEQAVVSLVKEKPQQLELVMTGRNPPEQLMELADYISEIKKQKHPYDRGIPARNGIER